MVAKPGKILINVFLFTFMALPVQKYNKEAIVAKWLSAEIGIRTFRGLSRPQRPFLFLSRGMGRGEQKASGGWGGGYSKCAGNGLKKES